MDTTASGNRPFTDLFKMSRDFIPKKKVKHDRDFIKFNCIREKKIENFPKNKAKKRTGKGAGRFSAVIVNKKVPLNNMKKVSQ